MSLIFLILLNKISLTQFDFDNFIKIISIIIIIKRVYFNAECLTFRLVDRFGRVDMLGRMGLVSDRIGFYWVEEVLR